MNFDWDTKQKQLILDIEQFAETYFKQRTTPSGFDRDAWKACAGQGLLGIALPDQQTKGNKPELLNTTGCFEALGRKGASPGLVFALGAHLFGCAMPVSRYATRQMQKDWCEKLATGNAIGALAVTEPGGGSNPSKLNTSASELKNGFVINGEKILITNAPVADLFLVLAATKPEGGIFGLTTFLIPSKTPGLTVEPYKENPGLKGATMGRIIFDDCKVSEDAIVGSLNSGFHIFNKTMLWERTGLLAGLLGIAQRDIEYCINFVNGRHGMHGPLAVYQSISHRIAEMKLRVESARLLVCHAAWAIDNGMQDTNIRASMAKYHVSETLLQNAIDSIRIRAGSGWITNEGDDIAYQIQDAVGTLFASGTSEIQLNIIAAELGLKRR